MEGRSVAAIYDFHKAVEQAKSTDDEQKAWTYSGQEFWLYGRNALDRAADVDVSSLRALRASLYETANMHLDRGHAMMPLTFWARASVAFDLEDFAATVENAQHALTLATNGLGQGGLRLAPAYNILGLALRKLGDDVLAAEAFREGLSADASNHELLANLGSLEMDAGDAGAAAAHFEESLRLRPTSAEVLNNYGYFEERRGDQAKALRLYKEARQALLPNVHDQIETNIRNLEDRLATVEEAAAEA
mmetsp:Transcript_23839/g.85082  ORF Transcript_23839/g.85082 Transcript_23839/m.85082 type:complete len:248 (-) Transcript_23839:1771-2514(-)